MDTTKKGFTLIELLLVIGILAILATTTVLVLNPARFFQEARDAQRLNDLGAINGAIALYLSTTTAVPTVNSAGDFGCADAGTKNYGSSRTPAPGSRYTASVTAPAAGAHMGTFGTDGTGWVPINLGAGVAEGAALGALPKDPTNSAALNYQYACSTAGAAGRYKLTADMESAKYVAGGANDVEGTDGGTLGTIYEVGTGAALAL